MRKRGMEVLAVLLLIIFMALAFRLGYLMLARGGELSARAEKQHSRSLDYYQYGRGDILDREGRSFTSRREPCLVLIPQMLREDALPELAAALSGLLSVDEELALSRLRAVKKQILSPCVFKTGLSNAEAEAVREAGLTGVVVLTLASRYGREAIAPHLLGQLQAGAKADEMHGVSGIERLYDTELTGRLDDKAVSWVDATGRPASEDWRVYSPDAYYRRDVRLTLDMDYQQIAERALGEYEGACVILDPRSGDILAAASTPGFDAYGWQQPATTDALVNKAFSSYPPASTFKILLALTAADSGLPAALEDFCCEGNARVGESHNINCWKRTGHGELDLPHALAYSCNAYFASLGWELSGARLRDYLKRCGLDEQRIIGYEAPAVAPLLFNDAIAGDVANVSIGENGVRLSPLMVAQLVAIAANGGYALTPRLTVGVQDQDGVMVSETPSAPPRRAVTARAAQQVAGMLRLAVTDGTVKALREALLPVAAKSGTSEAGGVWCAGFAPYQDGDNSAARWAIAVYVADGQAGSQEAAAVFKRVIDDIAILEGLGEINN